jgi:hypothetical protein
MSESLAYWERELNEATGRLKWLERDEDQMNPQSGEKKRGAKVRAQTKEPAG